jgi:ABC-type phosphate/phosphonate transport system substrate-binding protein
VAHSSGEPRSPKPLVGCARMYASSPSLAEAWRKLLTRVSATSRVDLEVIEHAYPAPLDELWEREDMGCVFMCGYPWALRRDRPRLLAAPVPSPARYGNQPIYFTDFVVRADSPDQTLEDTFGRRLAYSIENSHSGYNAARHHLLAYRTASRPTLYTETLGPLVSQRRVLDAVIEGRADIGPIDSYLLDLWRSHLPEVTAAVRVIATTEPAPSPPLVASAMIADDMCARLTAALLEAHRDSALVSTLEALQLARFVGVAPERFDVFLERQRAAESAGYPVLA